MKLGLSRGFPIDPLIPLLSELMRAFKGLELTFVRGTASEICEALKRGDIEVALAGPLDQSWERLESWALFAQKFDVIVHRSHALAARNKATIDDLRGEKLLQRTYCEMFGATQTLLSEHGVHSTVKHQIASENDLVALLEAQVGIAIVPSILPAGPLLRHVGVEGLDIKCAVSAYGVAGRQRSPVASTFIKLLRAADWSFLDPVARVEASAA